MVILMTPDVNVILLDFGRDTVSREVVTENTDGDYTIFINSRLSRNLQLEAYDHAMKHIRENDFEKADVQMIEHYAHQSKVQEIKPIPAEKYRERIERELKRIRAHRKKLQQQIEDDNRRIEFLTKCGVDFFAAAENDFLYGSDL